jgi:general secretion pathway protein G
MRRRGFTLIELLVVMSIVALLASIVAPRYFHSLQRGKEVALRQTLATVRDAIDQFAADKGRYPESLDELVTARYLRQWPLDPITGQGDAWQLLPPPADAGMSGALYELHSGAPGKASDGSTFAEW